MKYSTTHSLLRIFLSLSIVFPPAMATAQTGPGGVGDAQTNAVWLDASTLGGVADGGFVSVWNDRSGNGRDAAQAAAASRPAFLANALNGKSAVRFSRSSQKQYLEITAPGTGQVFSQGSTIIAVARANSGGADNTKETQQAIFSLPGYHSGLYFAGHPQSQSFASFQWLGGTIPANPAPATQLVTYEPYTQGNWAVASQTVRVSAGSSVLGSHVDGLASNAPVSAPVSAPGLPTSYRDLARIGTAFADDGGEYV